MDWRFENRLYIWRLIPNLVVKRFLVVLAGVGRVFGLAILESPLHYPKPPLTIAVARLESTVMEQFIMATKALSRYVNRNPEILGGEPIITGTRTSVRAIVGLWQMGIMPEEILSHLPHLTLAQVFDVLSFYLDNQGEINEYIEKNRVPDELVHPSVKSVLRAG